MISCTPIVSLVIVALWFCTVLKDAAFAVICKAVMLSPCLGLLAYLLRDSIGSDESAL